jgi:hypothetical protein
MVQAAFDATLGDHGSHSHWFNVNERHSMGQAILAFPQHMTGRFSTGMYPRPNFNNGVSIRATSHFFTPRYVEVGESRSEPTVNVGAATAADTAALAAHRAAATRLFGSNDAQLAHRISDAIHLLGRPAHYGIDVHNLAGLLSARLIAAIPEGPADRNAFGAFIRNLATEIYHDEQTRHQPMRIDHTQLRRALEATFNSSAAYADFIDQPELDALIAQISDFRIDEAAQATCPVCRARIHAPNHACSRCTIAVAAVGPLCESCLNRRDDNIDEDVEDPFRCIPSTHATVVDPLPVISEDLELLILNNASSLLANADLPELAHFGSTVDANHRRTVTAALTTAIQAVCRHSRVPNLNPQLLRTDLPGGLSSSVVINVRQTHHAGSDFPNNEERPAP